MNPIKKTITYIKESIAEMKKVVWPTKKQTTTFTIVVIAMAIGMAVFFSILDWVFSKGLGAII